MKIFALTLVAVLIGIYVYARVTTPATSSGTDPVTGKPALPVNSGGYFSAGDLDPVTGAQLAPGARAGTVQFSAQGN